MFYAKFMAFFGINHVLWHVKYDHKFCFRFPNYQSKQSRNSMAAAVVLAHASFLECLKCRTDGFQVGVTLIQTKIQQSQLLEITRQKIQQNTFLKTADALHQCIKHLRPEFH